MSEDLAGPSGSGSGRPVPPPLQSQQQQAQPPQQPSLQERHQYAQALNGLEPESSRAQAQYATYRAAAQSYAPSPPSSASEFAAGAGTSTPIAVPGSAGFGSLASSSSAGSSGGGGGPPSSGGAATPGRKVNTRGSRLGAQLGRSISPLPSAGSGSDSGSGSAGGAFGANGFPHAAGSSAGAMPGATGASPSAFAALQQQLQLGQLNAPASAQVETSGGDAAASEDIASPASGYASQAQGAAQRPVPPVRSASGGASSRVASLASRWGGLASGSALAHPSPPPGPPPAAALPALPQTRDSNSHAAAPVEQPAPPAAPSSVGGGIRARAAVFGFKAPRRSNTTDGAVPAASSAAGANGQPQAPPSPPMEALESPTFQTEPLRIGGRPRLPSKLATAPGPLSGSAYSHGASNSDTEGDRVLHARNGQLSPVAETRRRDSRLGKASSHSDLLATAAAQAQGAQSPTASGVVMSEVASRGFFTANGGADGAAELQQQQQQQQQQQRFAAAHAASRLSRLQYNRPDSEQTSDWEAMRLAQSPPPQRGPGEEGAQFGRRASDASRTLPGNTPPGARMQKELLLPALQGVRAGNNLQPAPKDEPDAQHAAGERNGGTETRQSSSQSRPLRNGDAASTLSPTVQHGAAASPALSAASPLSPAPSPAGNEAPARSQEGHPRAGLLTDREIAQLGAIPGAPPESLLNADGAPLNSKNILTIALQKAQNAVMLDGANNVPEAIAAYKQAVRLLQEVMERISPRPGKRARSSREEERRRLRVIHDTYADRIRLLSMIYVPEEGLDGQASSSPLASLAGEWQPSPAVERSGLNIAAEAVQSPSSARLEDSIASSSRPHSAKLADFSSQRNSLAPERSDSPDSHSQDRGGRSLRQASFETARVDGVQTPDGSQRGADLAPSIAIEPGSPRSALSGDERELKEELRDERFAPALASRSRKSSDASTGSGYSSAKISPKAGFRSLQRSSVEAPLLTARSHAFGIDEEIRTPATPYFDVDPNLGSEEGRATPQMKAESPRVRELSSQRPSRLQRSVSSPTLADDAVKASKRPAVPSLDPATAALAQQQPDPKVGLQSPPASSSPLLVSTTTLGGTISQRRRGMSSASRPYDDSSSRPGSETSTPVLGSAQSGVFSTHSQLQKALEQPADKTPTGTIAGRQRAISQPSNRRPSLPASYFPGAGSRDSGAVPPVPALPRHPAMPQYEQIPTRGRTSTATPSSYRFPSQVPEQKRSPNLALRDTNASYRAAAARDALFPSRLPSGICSGTPSYSSDGIGANLPWLQVPSMPPHSPTSIPGLPSAVSLRAFVLMRLLHATLASHGFVSKRLHISSAIWAQQTSKLQAVDSKVKALEIIANAVDTLERTGDSILGGNVKEESGFALVGARFAAALEEFEVLIDEVQNTLAKKLSFIPTVSGKKGGSGFVSFGSRLTRSFGAMTNSKSSADGPTAYTDLLLRLLTKAQMFERHALALGRAQITGLGMSGYDEDSANNYAYVSAESRAVIENKIKRASDFFGSVVLAFVLRDIGVLLEKSLKRSTGPLVE